MKRILISPKIIKDDYGQSGQFLDTAWIKYFKNKADLFTWNPKSIISKNNFIFDGLILSGGNDIFSIKKIKKIS